MAAAMKCGGYATIECYLKLMRPEVFPDLLTVYSTTQEAAAPAHLRPGRGVAEDRGKEEQVPRPRTAKFRDPEENLCEGS